MKRFVVLQEIWLDEVESEHNPGYEPIADFDDLGEAEDYVSSLQHPEDFHIEDSSPDPDDDEDEDEVLDEEEDFYDPYYRDNDDELYDVDTLDEREDFHSDDGRSDDDGDDGFRD